MAMNFVPLEREKHKSLKVNFSPAFEFAKGTHIAAATLAEFAQLGGTAPIVLIKDQDGRFITVAMLGFEAEQNLFLQGDRWEGPHVPMNIARYPFDIRPNGDKLTIFIDENSDLFSESGDPLFDDQGQPTTALKERQKYLSDLANSEMATHRFVDKCVELDLLEEIEILLTYEDGTYRNVTGMYSVNEKKLLNLEDDKLLEFHRNSFAGAAYSLMISMAQLSRLVELSRNTDKPIGRLQVKRKDSDQDTAQAANA